MEAALKNRRGQTSIEYLLLMMVAFLATYIAITGPIATFTTGMITQIKNVTRSITYSGEISPRRQTNPYDPSRLKAVHR